MTRPTPLCAPRALAPRAAVAVLALNVLFAGCESPAEPLAPEVTPAAALGSLADSGLYFEFTKIVDTETAVPGGAGTFDAVGQVSLRNGRFAFRASASTGPGIYVGTASDPSTIGVAYDTDTQIPGGSGTFTQFHTPSSSWGRLAFRGEGSGGQDGIYTDASGALEVAADRGTSIPGGHGTFERFSNPWMYGGALVFRATGPDGQDGIYMFDGSLRMVANTGIHIPGGHGPFETFGGGNVHGFLFGIPAIDDDGCVVFRGSGGGRAGVYMANPHGTLTTIADTDTPIPGGAGTFSSFETSVQAGNVQHGHVVFAADGLGPHGGLYSWTPSGLSVIADNATPAPGGSTFRNTGAQGFGLDDGVVSFLADVPPAPQAIFTTMGGSLRRVIANHQVLEGRPVVAMGTYGESLDGYHLGFNVGNFGAVADPNPPQAIFVASLTRAVGIDIKPGDGVNSVQPRSRGRIPVAILSAPDFDATAVATSSLTFGRTGHEPSLARCDRGKADVNGDGLPDLVCHFFTAIAGFESGDTEGFLRGQDGDGIPLRGSDAVRIVGR